MLRWSDYEINIIFVLTGRWRLACCKSDNRGRGGSRDCKNMIQVKDKHHKAWAWPTSVFSCVNVKHDWMTYITLFVLPSASSKMLNVLHITVRDLHFNWRRQLYSSQRWKWRNCSKYSSNKNKNDLNFSEP